MAKADLARTGSTRCAIYTRKSSDEGLEQEFNSLDAQREACEAYIVSQRYAGWVAHTRRVPSDRGSGNSRASTKVQVVDRHARITPGLSARPS